MPVQRYTRMLCDLCFAEGVERDAAPARPLRVVVDRREAHVLLCAEHREEVGAYFARLGVGARTTDDSHTSAFSALSADERATLRRWLDRPRGRIGEADVEAWQDAGRPERRRARGRTGK